MNDNAQTKRHTFIQRKLTGSRYQIYAMSKERADTLKHMTSAMEDAEREIHKYYDMQAGAMGYATLDDDTRSSAPITEPTKEEIDRYQAMIKIMKVWRDRVPSGVRGIVIDHLKFGTSFDDISYQRAIDDEFEVRVQYNTGLNEYCIIRGWGDQFE
jgi:hypothetical protein